MQVHIVELYLEVFQKLFLSVLEFYTLPCATIQPKINARESFNSHTIEAVSPS